MTRKPLEFSFLLTVATTTVITSTALKDSGCGLSCMKNCTLRHFAADCCRHAAQRTAPQESHDGGTGRHLAPKSMVKERRRNDSVHVAHVRHPILIRKTQQEQPVVHFGHVRRLPSAPHGRRMYHEGMYRTSNVSKVPYTLMPKKGVEPEC
eukprot:3033312-Pleurochrysis_carterae.AAC.1